MASVDVLGQRIASYRLLFRAGAGGMGEVFVAAQHTDEGASRIVALKRLLPAYADAAPFLASMREEARLAALVHHRNVCRVFELVEDPEAGPVLVMEYLDGVPLRRLAGHASDLGLMLALLVQACEGVHAIHQLAGDDGRPMGIVHRDINPSNMIVTPDGTLKILDFGIARADDAPARTRTGQIKGTTPYLAPEQVLGKRVDRRADVFALGVTVFELLTGVSPFRRENEFLTQRAITDEEAPSLAQYRPEIPEPIRRVIAQAMSRDPDQRFATAAELGRAASIAFSMALPDRSAIGDMVTTRFELELDERRRRIERNVEELTSRPVEPVTSPAALATTEHTRPLVATQPLEVTQPLERTRPFKPARSTDPSPASEEPGAVVGAKQPTRRLWIGAVILAAAATLIGVVLGQRSAAPAGPAASPPAVATAPADAAASVVAPPPLVDAGASALDAPLPALPPAEHKHSTPAKKPVRATKRTASGAHPAASGPPGYVSIASRPFATIFVDDVRLGVTPLYRREVPSGKRRIRAECSCGKTQQFVIDVEPGVAARPRNLTW